MYSVVVIDDNRIAVEAIVRSTDWDLCGCQVAGSAYDGVAGLRLIEEVQPDIVVIDVREQGIDLGLLWDRTCRVAGKVPELGNRRDCRIDQTVCFFRPV